MRMRMTSRIALWLLAVLCVALQSAALESPAVGAVMDAVVTRMYATLSEAERANLDDAAVLAFLTEEERRILATQYWGFDVNIPADVYVMRHEEQAVAPFWLAASGFEKTGMTVRNENYRYEIWRKRFDAGPVELGINGFDMHRPHYFVAVAPVDKTAPLTLSNIVPEEQTLLEMRNGAMIYHDWTELVLLDVPEALAGGTLLTTIRGRSREAHLIGAFRVTPFPSSAAPDHIALTWSGDPRTTQTVQWRAAQGVQRGVVRYRNAEAQNWREAPAERTIIHDRLLSNDPKCARFTAVLRDLTPGTAYRYMVGHPDENAWSEEIAFNTAPDRDTPFTFGFMGDTHSSPHWGRLLSVAFERHPETAFYLLGGDLVGTGLFRNHWDEFFEYSTAVFRQRPVMPCIGNHDDQDGLGAGMYLDHFALPGNGPAHVTPERLYCFEYGNAFFAGLDIDTPYHEQAAWLDQRLAETRADWKFAMVHFPPYSPTLDYAEIRRHWEPVFNKHRVDMVFAGHVHYYMRSHPIREGRVVAPGEAGTVYVISIPIPNEQRPRPRPDYVAALLSGTPLYHTIHIAGNRLHFRAFDEAGTLHDELVMEK